MTMKVIGAVMIVAACGSFGFLTAASHRSTTASLKQLISVLQFMECELQCRLTPLPELCHRVSGICSGKVKRVFALLAAELEGQISPDAISCMECVLRKAGDLPAPIAKAFAQLGASLGNFTLDGQIKGIQAVYEQCAIDLETLLSNQDTRLRSYQTLGICAGAALVILFI